MFCRILHDRKGDKLPPRGTGLHEIESINATDVVKVKGYKAKISNMLMKPYRTVSYPEQPADVQDDDGVNKVPGHSWTPKNHQYHCCSWGTSTAIEV